MILKVYAISKPNLLSLRSYLLLLSFLERKWTNLLILQGRFKDVSFGRPFAKSTFASCLFRFFIIESGHSSQLNL